MPQALPYSVTPQQLKFCEEYIKDPSPTRAARKAGFSNGAYGRQLIHKPFIQQAIQRIQNKVANQTGITIKWVVDELTDLYQEARSKEDITSARGCLELLGKHVGAFSADNTQKGNKVQVVMNFNYQDNKPQLPDTEQVIDYIENSQKQLPE